MHVYKLYHTATATTNAGANVIIQRKGRIKGILMSSQFDSVTDNAKVELELSFASVSQTATNDTVGPIAEQRFYGNFVTSGLDVGAINTAIPALDLEVVAGDRLYLNSVVSGTVQYYSAVFLYVDE